MVAPLCVEAEASPVNKVVSMISDLQARITGEWGTAHKRYTELVESGEDRVRNLGFEIETGISEAENLTAATAKEGATLSN